MRARGWQVALALLLLGVVVWLGARDGAWWRDVCSGAPLEFEVLTVAELPIPLIEVYGQKRWAIGVDVYPGSGAGQIYVLLRRGQCPTGGYRIEPIAVRLVRRFAAYEIRVQSKYNIPQPGQMVIEVVTFPAVGLRIRADRKLTGCSVVALDQDGKVVSRAEPVR
ncbi:MAG: protease complex subunit PrcB family protein [Bacillota bacterium]|nr:protease complex subunit PrcB family protein [Bacillota bacterium]